MSIDPRSLKAPDPAQWDEYDKPRPMVPAGRMSLQAPDKFTIEGDDDGVLKVLLGTVKIVEAPVGWKDQIGFERLNSRPRATGRMKGTSRLTDYLRACGVGPVRSTDPEDWIQAIESTSGSFFEAFVDWRAWDSETSEEVAGSYADFPDDGEGGKLNYIVNSKTGKRVAAQYRIRYYVTRRS